MFLQGTRRSQQIVQGSLIAVGYKRCAPASGEMGGPGASQQNVPISSLSGKSLKMRMHSIALALVAGASLSMAGVAHAGTAVDLSRLSPKQQAHLAKLQAQKRAISPQYNYDIKPPVLRAIGVGGTVNANMLGAQAVVSLTMVDNLAGIGHAGIWVQGPSGQQLYGEWDSRYETTRENVQVGIDMTGASDTGTWRVVSVSLSDANGNLSNYDEAALAALGSTAFGVKGAAGDNESPWLNTGGAVLTPVVSRSTPPAGMLPGSPARIGVTVKVGDAGASGLRYATAEFCNEFFDCFYVSGELSVRGKHGATLTLGAHINEWTSVGTYTAYSIYVYDYAGNGQTYYQWEYDLGAFIGTPVITITE